MSVDAPRCHLNLPMNVLLAGHCGAGKTSIGRALGKISGVPFVDLDEAAAKMLGFENLDQFFMANPNPSAYHKVNDAEIRILERHNNYGKHNTVFALGGWMTFKDIPFHNKFYRVHLLAPPKILIKRLKQSDRPPKTIAAQIKHIKSARITTRWEVPLDLHDMYLDTSQNSITTMAQVMLPLLHNHNDVKY